MQKRGQVTVFIILGLMIVIVGFFLFFFADLSQKQFSDQNEVQQLFFSNPVELFVQSCLKQTAEQGLIFLGRQGGYYDLPEVYNPEFNLPYYFYETETKILSKEQLEEQLALYVDTELFFCLENFAYFQEQGYNIEESLSETKVTLNRDKIILDTYYPLAISQDVFTKTISDFRIVIPSRIGQIHQFANDYLNEHEPDSICLSCLDRLAIKNDLQVEVIPIRDEAIFRIIDREDNLINYEFLFMNKYIYPELDLRKLGLEDGDGLSSLQLVWEEEQKGEEDVLEN